MDHLSKNKLLSSFQPAYVKTHLTETTLRSIHDCSIRTMSLKQITCLCLTDLPAAFDIVDHSILLECLG